MTSRETAQQIVDRIRDIIGFYKEDVESSAVAGRNDLAERYQASVDTLEMLASGLQSSIDQGEYD
jgi:hypothetical protein